MTLKIGILISGRGSNMAAILDHWKSKKLDISPEIVLSNKPDAAGIQIARDFGVQALAISPKDFSSNEVYEMELVRHLQAKKVEWVILAGYMKLLGKPLLEAYPNRILNIHPSLLPAFKGLHAQRQALEYGVKVAGCTVHIVTAEMDAGPIVLQATVPVLPDDTEESLSARILVAEHRLYPEAIALVAKGQLKIG